tara:strand:- start:393 stop:596 length:204 start_codon:yes stop_codon:yes gene_type:complete
MSLENNQIKQVSELVALLDKDRLILLQQIDNGNWSEFRNDLAALERELGQLLNRATDAIEEARNLRE